MSFYMNIQKRIIRPIPIVYMRRIGEYGPENHKLMEHMKSWICDNDLYDAQTVILGISWDNPSVTKAEQCRYDVCMVAETKEIPHSEIIAYGQISGGCYVVFLIEHTETAVQLAWSSCFSTLLELGYMLDETRPIIERYKKELVDQHYCELCVPIRNTEK